MVDNKIMKHKYLIFFLFFVFSMMFGKIESQAAENNYSYYYAFSNYNSTDYFTKKYSFNSDYKLALVYAGETDISCNLGTFKRQRYYPLIDSENTNIDSNVEYFFKNSDGSVRKQISTSETASFFSVEFVKSSSNFTFLESCIEPLDTNIPIFSTLNQAENYFLTGDTTGQINKEFSNFHDFSQDIYTVDIPVPELSKLCFTGFDINNNHNDIYNVDLIIQTNYYGVSYQKKGLVNVYAVDYDWIYKKHYYNISDFKSNHVKKSQINVLGDFGVDIFSDYVSDFISWGRNYPNITDLPNYSFIWYNSAASQTYYNTRHVQEDLIDETTLKMTGQPEVIYYVRFYDDSGNFGRWARYSYRADDVKLRSVVNVGQLDIGEDGSYIIDNNGNPSTSQTITTNQNFITNETEDNRFDFDITSATNFFDYIKSIFDSIISSLNSFGNLIKACLGFLPDDLLNAIVAGIVIMLFVGVVKVVRG